MSEFMSQNIGYRHTIRASYLGYVTQAIVNNLAPLLFLTFQDVYGISMEQITFLITLNFGIQLLILIFQKHQFLQKQEHDNY